jgi:hypothetical protein
MQRAGQRRCCGPESWLGGVSKSAEGGTPSHRHSIRWQAGGRMEHAMVTQSPTMPLQCARTGNGMFEAYLCAGVGVNETVVFGEGLEVDERRSEPR